MCNQHWLAAAAGLVIASLAHGGAREVQVAPVPDWVAPVPAPTSSATPANAPVRVVYSDNQVRLGADEDEIYSAYRLKILQPQALSVGNISITWNPDAGEARVHFIRIIRDGEVIDVLKSTEFQVLQREGFLGALDPERRPDRDASGARIAGW
jgi:hypothetical protein